MSASSSPLQFLDPDARAAIEAEAVIKELPADLEILREGQYVKVVPIVLDGLIKVFSRYEEKELLLYYIQPNESCVMSFSACMSNAPSKVIAVTEEPTTAMLLPVEKVPGWVAQYPQLNELFFQQYGTRYSDLLNTIHHVLFNKMDVRLLDYLREKVTLTGRNPLKMTHRQIANELGTAREVVSRVMKKLEAEGAVQQQGTSIHLLQR